MNHGRMKPGQRQFRYYVLGTLIAAEFLMSFTFLGYIHISPISITFAYIPILVAGCLLGPLESAAVGVVFGLASMYKASSYYVMPGDKIFSPFLSGEPASSLLLSIGARTAFGLAVGILFFLAKKSRHRRAWFAVIAALGRRLHSFFVYAAMGLLFPEQGRGIENVFDDVLTPSSMLLSALCILIVEASFSLYHSQIVKRVRAYIELADQISEKRRTHRLLSVFIWGSLCAAAISAVYFAQRMSYMLEAHGLEISYETDHDLLHLQIQFLIAVLSLAFIMAMLAAVAYKYLLYKEYLGQLDNLTGVPGRKMFLSYCEKLLGGREGSGAEGCFLFIDVDYFKEINDTLGHPEGDRALKEIAGYLQQMFSEGSCVGRMGGDEFALIINRTPELAELKSRLDEFLRNVGGILSEPRKISCSIGAYYFSDSEKLEQIYSQTDKLLYEAKQGGRAQYIIGRGNKIL